jgi:hypothetical protein
VVNFFQVEGPHTLDGITSKRNSMIQNLNEVTIERKQIIFRLYHRPSDN